MVAEPDEDNAEMAEVRQAALADTKGIFTAEAKAEARDLFEGLLTVAGFLTRTIVYLLVITALWYWLWPSTDFASRSLGNLTVKEIAEPLIFIGVLIFWFQLFVNYPGDTPVSWRNWGWVGLSLLAGLAFAWLHNQQG